MDVVTADRRRTTTTPNATMTTLASPSLGGAACSVWLVAMPPGADGPEHAFAGEVVWAITRGSATLRRGADVTRLGPGDTAVLEGGLQRAFSAGPDGFEAVVTTSVPGTVTRADGTVVGTPEWVA